MFKNRFLLVLGVLSILLVTMAVSRPLSNTSSANLSWPPRPVIIPITGANSLSDYYERHSDLSALADVAAPVTGILAASDYFQRHTENIAPAGSNDLSDYFLRH